MLGLHQPNQGLEKPPATASATGVADRAAGPRPPPKPQISFLPMRENLDGHPGNVSEEESTEVRALGCQTGAVGVMPCLRLQRVSLCHACRWRWPLDVVTLWLGLSSWVTSGKSHHRSEPRVTIPMLPRSRGRSTRQIPLSVRPALSPTAARGRGSEVFLSIGCCTIRDLPGGPGPHRFGLRHCHRLCAVST